MLIIGCKNSPRPIEDTRRAHVLVGFGEKTGRVCHEPVPAAMTDATAPATGAHFTMSTGSAGNGYYIATLPAIGGALIGLITMLLFTNIVLKKPVGSEKMKLLAEKIHKGSVDFLLTEYKFLMVFVACIFVSVVGMLFNAERPSDNVKYGLFGLWTAIPLLVGATLSAYAGFRGMKIATEANVRTTAACDPGKHHRGAAPFRPRARSRRSADADAARASRATQRRAARSTRASRSPSSRAPSWASA